LAWLLVKVRFCTIFLAKPPYGDCDACMAYPANLPPGKGDDLHAVSGKAAHVLVRFCVPSLAEPPPGKGDVMHDVPGRATPWYG
jgi:hypothetical protein